MKTRILGMIATAAVVITMAGTPASAAESKLAEFAGAADARALFLSLFENDLTFGLTHAEMTHAPKAEANGVGLATPLTNQGEGSGSVTADGTEDGSTTENCSPLSLPDIPVLALQTACGSGFAEITGGNPHAVATGKVAAVSVNATDILSETPLPDIILDTVDQINEGLAPIFDPINENLGLDAQSTIGELFEALLGESAAELVSITLGPTTAETLVTDGAIKAVSTAEGATIDVLSRLNLPPVLRIIVGSATSTATVDDQSGTPEGTFEPALVRVIVAGDILDNLPPELVAALNLQGAEANEIVVPVGQTVCLLEGTPLESCIIAANGESTVDGDTVTVNTSAVRLDLLKGVSGGVVLALADTSASAGGTLVVPPVEPPTPERPEPELPRTGVDLGLGTGAAAIAAAFAGLGLAVTRRAGLRRS